MRGIEALAHLTLAVEDTGRAVKDYEALLDMSAVSRRDEAGDEVHAFQTGNVGLLLRRRQVGEALGLAGMAFRVADLSRAHDTLARCGIAVEDGELDAGTTHGLPMSLVDTPAESNSRVGITLDHVVIRTPAPERAVALYGGRLGLDMRLDRSNPAWNARLMFFRCGDLVVEIVHPLSDGVSDGPDSFGGLSWRVPDIDVAHARLTGRGFDLSPVRTGRRPGSRVCTIRSRTAGVPTIMLGVSPRA